MVQSQDGGVENNFRLCLCGIRWCLHSEGRGVRLCGGSVYIKKTCWILGVHRWLLLCL